MLLPVDCVLAREFNAEAEMLIVDYDKIPDGWEGMDIGPKTRELYAQAVKPARRLYGTDLWAYLNFPVLPRALRLWPRL